MLLISEIYDDVALDNINTAENGDLSYSMFNRISKRAELRMLDFLSGDVENLKPPTPYTNIKDKSWLSQYIKSYPVQVINGEVVKPVDYYNFENMYLLGQFDEVSNCTTPIVNNGVSSNTGIELLNGDQFTERSETYIVGLQPSFKRPISKIVGKNFVFNPFDLGSIVLEYVAYPVYGKIITKFDNVYNQEVIDENLSTNYQYDEFARELLVYFISDTFSIHTRENALKQQLLATGALVRDAKQ